MQYIHFANNLLIQKDVMGGKPSESIAQWLNVDNVTKEEHKKMFEKTAIEKKTIDWILYYTGTMYSC